MPKTRKSRAAELLQTIKTGPHFDNSFIAGHYGPHNALNEYLLWAETYVIPELLKLIPELKDKGNK